MGRVAWARLSSRRGVERSGKDAKPGWGWLMAPPRQAGGGLSRFGLGADAPGGWSIGDERVGPLVRGEKSIAFTAVFASLE